MRVSGCVRVCVCVCVCVRVATVFECGPRILQFHPCPSLVQLTFLHLRITLPIHSQGKARSGNEYGPLTDLPDWTYAGKRRLWPQWCPRNTLLTHTSRSARRLLCSVRLCWCGWWSQVVVVVVVVSGARMCVRARVCVLCVCVCVCVSVWLCLCLRVYVCVLFFLFFLGWGVGGCYELGHYTCRTHVPCAG